MGKRNRIDRPSVCRTALLIFLGPDDAGSSIAAVLSTVVDKYTRGTVTHEVRHDRGSNVFYLPDRAACEETTDVIERAYASYIDTSFRDCAWAISWGTAHERGRFARSVYTGAHAAASRTRVCAHCTRAARAHRGGAPSP